MAHTSTHTGMQRYLNMLNELQAQGKIAKDVRGVYNYGGKVSVTNSYLEKQVKALRKENAKLRETAQKVSQAATQTELLREKQKQDWAKNYSKPAQFGNVDHIKSVGNGL